MIINLNDRVMLSTGKNLLTINENSFSNNRAKRYQPRKTISRVLACATNLLNNKGTEQLLTNNLCISIKDTNRKNQYNLTKIQYINLNFYIHYILSRFHVYRNNVRKKVCNQITLIFLFLSLDMEHAYILCTEFCSV